MLFSSSLTLSKVEKFISPCQDSGSGSFFSFEILDDTHPVSQFEDIPTFRGSLRKIVDESINLETVNIHFSAHQV